MTYTLNRFYIPEHCSTGSRILGTILQLRWINAGTISKEVELRDIHVISRFITNAKLATKEIGKNLGQSLGKGLVNEATKGGMSEAFKVEGTKVILKIFKGAAYSEGKEAFKKND